MVSVPLPAGEVAQLTSISYHLLARVTLLGRTPADSLVERFAKDSPPLPLRQFAQLGPLSVWAGFLPIRRHSQIRQSRDEPLLHLGVGVHDKIPWFDDYYWARQSLDGQSVR